MLNKCHESKNITFKINEMSLLSGKDVVLRRLILNHWNPLKHTECFKCIYWSEMKMQWLSDMG